MSRRRIVPPELASDCPACGAVRGVRCMDKRYRVTDPDSGEAVYVFIDKVHPERVTSDTLCSSGGQDD